MAKPPLIRSAAMRTTAVACAMCALFCGSMILAWVISRVAPASPSQQRLVAHAVGGARIALPLQWRLHNRLLQNDRPIEWDFRSESDPSARLRVRSLTTSRPASLLEVLREIAPTTVPAGAQLLMSEPEGFQWGRWEGAIFVMIVAPEGPDAAESPRTVLARAVATAQPTRFYIFELSRTLSPQGDMRLAHAAQRARLARIVTSLEKGPGSAPDVPENRPNRAP